MREKKILKVKWKIDSFPVNKMSFGFPEHSSWQKWIFSEAYGTFLVERNVYDDAVVAQQGAFAPKLRSQGAALGDVIAAFLNAVLKQINEVWKKALLPVRLLVLSGCGRGLPSCQVCWLDSEENLFSLTHY